MMGLNYNWTTMNSLVDSMQPSGNTNQPIGLVWGWQSLVGGGPLTAPTIDTNYTYQEIIILLSDGLNTEDRWYTSQTPVDNRMYQTGNGSGTCANIKAAGITIYTIQVNTGGDPTSTPAAELRQLDGQVLSADHCQRHIDGVHVDRHRVDQAAGGQIGARKTAGRANAFNLKLVRARFEACSSERDDRALTSAYAILRPRHSRPFNHSNH